LKTLLIYSYRDYPDSAANLKYFTRHLRSIKDDCRAILYVNARKLIDFDISDFDEVRETSAAIDLEDFRDGLNGIDFGAYDHFIFMNSSCIGPIVPLYCQGNWVDLLRAYMESQQAHLVGPVIEVPPDDLGSRASAQFKSIKAGHRNVPFVHTYFILVTRRALTALLEYGALSVGTLDKDEAILVRERLMTSALLDAGLNVASLQRIFEGVDWRDPSNWEKYRPAEGALSCPEVPGNYRGADLDPYEVMFFKNIRHPNAFRPEDVSGISDNLKKYLENVVIGPELK
jgi:hypothetical protein